MITDWNELVDNAIYKEQLTHLMRECSNFSSETNQFTPERWKTILENLRSPQNDWLKLALLVRTLYYLECSMDDSLTERKSYMLAAKKDIDKCLSLSKARSWNKEGGLFAIVIPFCISVPWPILFYYAGSLHGLYASKRDQDLAIKNYNRYNLAMFNHLGKENHNELLSFRRYNEYTLSDIIEDMVTSMPPKRMNDCIDSLVFPWMDFRIEELNSRLKSATTPTVKARRQRNLDSFNLMKKSMENYRIRSFVKPGEDLINVTNPLMWAHYANEHNGIAILYSFDESYGSERDSFWALKEVEYAVPGKPIDLSKKVLDIKTGLLIKSHDWKYENEVRLISYDCNCKTEYKQMALGTIRKVFFGIRCQDQTISTIKKLLGAYGSPVEFYKMKTVEKDILKFSYDKI